MTFAECVLECFDTPVLVAEFNRLSGYSLGIDYRSNLERAIDEAAGYEPQEEGLRAFIAFVYRVVWLPMVAESEATE